MSNEQIVTGAMRLPLSEKIQLAQTLWQSINASLTETNEHEAIAEAVCRDGELSAGQVRGRSHDEVMRAARSALGCA